MRRGYRLDQTAERELVTVPPIAQLAEVQEGWQKTALRRCFQVASLHQQLLEYRDMASALFSLVTAAWHLCDTCAYSNGQ
jgi:hypothetical protein